MEQTVMLIVPWCSGRMLRVEEREEPHMIRRDLNSDVFLEQRTLSSERESLGSESAFAEVGVMAWDNPATKKIRPSSAAQKRTGCSDTTHTQSRNEIDPWCRCAAEQSRNGGQKRQADRGDTSPAVIPAH